MASIDHYGHALHVQLSQATKRGAKHFTITSTELHSALNGRSEVNDECWNAMEAAMMPGDVIIDRVTVRYVLPRP
ncbi:hypothetical protein V1282_006561 [Nitrobacteraceae bacterium AZCC 2146]|jgi:hypothetical protein